MGNAILFPFNYCIYVNRVKSNLKARMTKEDAVSEAVDYAICSNLLNGYFKSQKMEVLNMSLTELSRNIAIVLLALSVVVQITPIKLNPWTWIARKVGKAINHDEIEKINRIDKGVKYGRN